MYSSEYVQCVQCVQCVRTMCIYLYSVYVHVHCMYSVYAQCVQRVRTMCVYNVYVHVQCMYSVYVQCACTCTVYVQFCPALRMTYDRSLFHFTGLGKEV